MESMNNIIFQDINDQYAYGQYMSLRVIIMKENGFVNATKLCDDAEGKRYRNWNRTQNAQEMIKEVARSEMSDPEIIINNGDPLTSGTYVHADLIPHIASWCSAKFAIKVSKIVNEYAINSFKNQIKEKDEEIKIKSDEYVPPLNDNRDNIFYITREPDNIYRLHRKQKKLYKPNPNIVFYTETPNAIKMANHFKQYVQCRYNIFTLGNKTEKYIIDVCKVLVSEKYDLLDAEKYKVLNE